MRLAGRMRKEVEKEGMTHLLEKVELPLAAVLAEMEITGVRIDVDALNEAASNLEARLGVLESDIHSLAGETFNVRLSGESGEILLRSWDLIQRRRRQRRVSIPRVRRSLRKWRRRIR